MEQLMPIMGLLVVVMVIGAIVKAVAGGGKGSQKDYPYQKEPTLFSPAERSFLGVLDQALGDQFRIMGKVRLADVIKVRPGLDASARQKAFNKIQSKHLDFVVCDPSDLSIQFAVELDDKSHKQKKRQDRDAFLDAAMNAAGVPIIHFPARKSYSIQDVRDKMSAHFGEPEAAEGANVDVAVNPETDMLPSESDSDAPLCTKCGGDMVLRKAARGKNAGNEFWGCSNYPKCKTLLPV